MTASSTGHRRCLAYALVALACASHVPDQQSAVAVSLWGAVGGLAAAVGPSLGSFVIASFGWQWAFYLDVPVGILAIWRGQATGGDEGNKPSGTHWIWWVCAC